MKVSELIESQLRRKASEEAAKIALSIQNNQPIWDAIAAALPSSPIHSSDESVHFSGEVINKFCDGEVITVAVDGNVTPDGIIWHTNLLVPEPLRSEVSKIHRISGTSLNLILQSIDPQDG